jgi:rubredoxin
MACKGDQKNGFAGKMDLPEKWICRKMDLPEEWICRKNGFDELPN